MSTSTTASAAWAQGSNANADNTASTSSRPKRAAASRRSNNGQDNQQSLSPVPSTSTLSTRSKVFTRSESGRLESPDKLDTTLPAASASTSARSTRRNSRSAPEASDQKRINGTSIPAYDEDQPRPDVIIEGVAVANTAAPSLTPETAAHEPLPILHADAVTAGLKRKLPLDEDATSLLNGNGGSSYDVTPLTSPAEADIMLPAVGAKGDETLGSVAGPKRAPRKKRKWLKKGEVDPDDAVAVAKQKERHMLIDQACDLIEDKMEAVRDGSDLALVTMLKELEQRRERQLARAKEREEHCLAELKQACDHANNATRAQFEEQSEQLLETLRTDLRHFKYKLINERQQHTRAQNPDDRYRARRSGRPWGVYPKTQLLSTGTERTTEFDVDGQIRERRPLATSVGTLAPREIEADLRALRMAASKVQHERAISPPKAKAPPAKPAGEGAREIYLNGYKHRERFPAPPRTYSDTPPPPPTRAPLPALPVGASVSGSGNGGMSSHRPPTLPPAREPIHPPSHASLSRPKPTSVIPQTASQVIPSSNPQQPPRPTLPTPTSGTNLFVPPAAQRRWTNNPWVR